MADVGDIVVKMKLDTSDFNSALATMQGKTTAFGAIMEKAFGSMGFGQVGKEASASIGSIVGAIGAIPLPAAAAAAAIATVGAAALTVGKQTLQMAADFQSAMAKVGATTGMNANQLRGLGDLMYKNTAAGSRLSMGAQANIAQALGGAGLIGETTSGADSLKMLKLVEQGMTALEAPTDDVVGLMSQLNVLYGYNIDQSTQFMSAQAAMADATAASNKEIMTATRDMTQVRGVMKMTGAQTVALAAATVSMGIGAAETGNQWKSLMRGIQSTTKPTLEAYAQLGITQDQVTKALNDSKLTGSNAPILTFLKELNTKIQASSDSARLMYQVFGSEGMMLGGSLDSVLTKYDELLKISEQNFASGSRLNQEYERQINTLNSLFDALSAKMSAIGTKIGSALLSPIQDAVYQIDQFVGNVMVGNFQQAFQQMYSAILGYNWTGAGITIAGMIGNGLLQVVKFSASVPAGLAAALLNFNWAAAGQSIGAQLIGALGSLITASADFGAWLRGGLSKAASVGQELAQGIWNSITGKLSGMGTWISQEFTKGGFTGLATAIYQAIVGAIDSAVSYMTGKFTGAGQWLKDRIMGVPQGSSSSTGWTPGELPKLNISGPGMPGYGSSSGGSNTYTTVDPNTGNVVTTTPGGASTGAASGPSSYIPPGLMDLGALGTGHDQAIARIKSIYEQTGVLPNGGVISNIENQTGYQFDTGEVAGLPGKYGWNKGATSASTNTPQPPALKDLLSYMYGPTWANLLAGSGNSGSLPAAGATSSVKYPEASAVSSAYQEVDGDITKMLKNMNEYSNALVKASAEGSDFCQVMTEFGYLQEQTAGLFYESYIGPLREAQSLSPATSGVSVGGKTSGGVQVGAAKQASGIQIGSAKTFSSTVTTGAQKAADFTTQASYEAYLRGQRANAEAEASAYNCFQMDVAGAEKYAGSADVWVAMNDGTIAKNMAADEARMAKLDEAFEGYGGKMAKFTELSTVKQTVAADYADKKARESADYLAGSVKGAGMGLTALSGISFAGIGSMLSGGGAAPVNNAASSILGWLNQEITNTTAQAGAGQISNQFLQGLLFPTTGFIQSLPQIASSFGKILPGKSDLGNFGTSTQIGGSYGSAYGGWYTGGAGISNGTGWGASASNAVSSGATSGYGWTNVGGTIRIGAHADGGIVMRPELATIAENGPEAIIPMNQMSETIAGALGINGSGFGGHSHPIYLNGQKVADAVGGAITGRLRNNTGMKVR